jgi:hypothetical protein
LTVNKKEAEHSILVATTLLETIFPAVSLTIPLHRTRQQRAPVSGVVGRTLAKITEYPIKDLMGAPLISLLAKTRHLMKELK